MSARSRGGNGGGDGEGAGLAGDQFVQAQQRGAVADQAQSAHVDVGDVGPLVLGVGPVDVAALVQLGDVHDGYRLAGVAAGVQQRAAVKGEPGRVAEVERRQGILTDEIRKIREFLVLPETQELKGQYGLGPGASKVYGIPRGLSICGYGEANFAIVTNDGSGAPNTFDLERFVLYAGYKFTDWLVFNSEIEFEHATTEDTVSAGGGAAEIEHTAHQGYGVGFPLAAKAEVRGSHQHPFYKWAAAEKPLELPRWNFHKYLIGRDGHLAASFATQVEPTDARVTSAIEKELTSGA